MWLALNCLRVWLLQGRLIIECIHLISVQIHKHVAGNPVDIKMYRIRLSGNYIPLRKSETRDRKYKPVIRTFSSNSLK